MAILRHRGCRDSLRKTLEDNRHVEPSGLGFQHLTKTFAAEEASACAKYLRCHCFACVSKPLATASSSPAKFPCTILDVHSK